MFATGPAFFRQPGAGYATLTLTGTYPAATIGVPYSADLTIAGGNGVNSVTGGTGLASGSLPPGLALSIVTSTLLRLSGTPTGSGGTYAFTASVSSGDGQTATSAQSVVSTAGYDSAVMAHSPLRYWKLDEASGTVATDSSGNGGHGTYQGTYTQATPSLLPGGSGNSWTKTGTGRVQLPFASVPYGQPLSFVAWIEPSAYPAAAAVVFGGSASAFQLALDPTGHPIAGRAGLVNFTRSSSVIALGTAHMVGVSISGGVGTYTIDGVAAGSFTGVSAFADLSTSYLGLYYDGTSYGYQGAMQRVALFPTALSVADMAALYAAA